MRSKPKTSRGMRALSIRQPFAEQILRGTKTKEYRSRPTRLLDQRFYIYASRRPRPAADFKRARISPADVPRGVLVGTAEIVKCVGRNGQYEWHVKNPQRLIRLLKPRNHPQPGWFRPF